MPTGLSSAGGAVQKQCKTADVPNNRGCVSENWTGFWKSSGAGEAIVHGYTGILAPGSYLTPLYYVRLTLNLYNSLNPSPDKVHWVWKWSSKSGGLRWIIEFLQIWPQRV